MTRALRFALVLLLSGCDGCGAAEPTSEPQPTTAEGEPAAGASLAIVEGTVRLAEGAAIPRYAQNPLVPPEGRPNPPDTCTPAQDTDQAPLQPTSTRGLGGLLVAMHDFATAPPAEPQTRELTITDCRLTPRLIDATRGDTLRLMNDTNYPYLPNFGGGFMQAVLYHGNREMELDQGGVRSLECGFAAPCGRTEIITLYHSLHTTTDETGHFRITGVPAGEELRISAWHPLVNEASETLTLRAGETRSVELVVTPAATPAPPTEPPETDGPAENNPDILF